MIGPPKTAGRLRVVLLSSLSPRMIWRLADRLNREAAGVRVVGVLHEVLVPKPFGRRVRNFIRNLRRPAYLPYVLSRIIGRPRATLVRLGHGLLRRIHGAPVSPNADPDIGIDELRARLERTGGRLHVTTNLHDDASLEFVQSLEPDLGIVYGTRILKPKLFEIPGRGSINIHKRKVPDYRGGGAIGLWELLDDQSEIGVTVHRVAVKLDAGDVVCTATIPIGPLDDLESLGLKADLVGEDLLIRAASDFANGTVRAIPQTGTGRMFKTPTVLRMREHEKTLRRRRPVPPPVRTRPLWKLLLRGLLFLPRVIVRNRSYHRRHAFPVVVLYHHVITDRPHTMGMSTAQFSRQVSFLMRHYRIVSLPEALDMLEAGRVNAPTVVLTFDDGYADNFVNVRSVLEPFGLSATFFICSDHVTRGTPFEHDLRAGDVGFEPLTWEQVAIMRRNGFVFGAHTRTHFDCGSTDVDRLIQEIRGCRSEIEERLGETVPFFSFPWGFPKNMSAEAVAIAKEVYEYVCSACGGVNHPGPSSHWHVLRPSHPESLLELELTLQSILELHPPGESLSL